MTEIAYSGYMQEQIARADNWFPMIASAHAEIVNIDTLWATTKDTPFYVPREAFRIAARGYEDQESILGIVNALPDTGIASRRFFKTGYQHMHSNYMWQLTWDGVHTETGKPFTASTVVWSDENLTQREIYDQAGEDLQGESPPLELFDLTVNISAMYHKRGTEW